MDPILGTTSSIFIVPALHQAHTQSNNYHYYDYDFHHYPVITYPIVQTHMQ